MFLFIIGLIKKIIKKLAQRFERIFVTRFILCEK